MYEGVLGAIISSINDGEYEYEMEVIVNPCIIDNLDDFNNILDNHIKTIANFTKFNVGKIKYNIKTNNINYVDSDREIQKNQSYVKHI